MNIVFALLGEHGILKHEIAALRRDAPGLTGVELRAAARAFAAAAESHAHLEDELLFGPLESSGRMPRGPVPAMRAEHDEIEKLLARLLDPAAGDREVEVLRRTLTRLLSVLEDHFAHEENVLFVLASRILDPSALERLGDGWAERRAVRVGERARTAFA